MRDETWLDAFEHGLEAAGVSLPDRASARVETEGFLREANVPAYEHFGPPGEYALELARALGAGRVRRSAGTTARSMVEADAISMSYGRTDVLRAISLSVVEGEVAVLIGPNGAGKSTLLRIIAGLERPDTGTVTLGGRVGYVPQTGGLDPYLTPLEHFDLFGAASGLARVDARREGTRLARELGWDAAAAPVAGELSGGTAQKLAVITALIPGPDILLLDEPYQGMDAESQRRFWEMLWALQESGRSAVVSSHSTDALARASKVIEIDGLAVR